MFNAVTHYSPSQDGALVLSYLACTLHTSVGLSPVDSMEFSTIHKGSFVTYQHLVRETFLPLLALHKFILKMTALSLMLTLSFVVEAVGFDNLLLDLGCHREHQLQHLSHVIAGTFSSLLHPCSIFWYWEGLDHLTQYHWEGNKASVIAVLQNILNRAWSRK